MPTNKEKLIQEIKYAVVKYCLETGDYNFKCAVSIEAFGTIDVNIMS